MRRGNHNCKIHKDYTVVCSTCGLVGAGVSKQEADRLAYGHKTGTENNKMA